MLQSDGYAVTKGNNTPLDLLLIYLTELFIMDTYTVA